MRTNIRSLSRFFILLLTLLSIQEAWASDPVGKIVFVKGKATVLHMDPRGSKDLNFDDSIFAMDTIETKNGTVKILFDDQTVMSLAENSKVLITEQVYQPKQGIRKSIFDILKGKVRTIVEKVAQDSDVRLQTPTAVAGIRGTDVGIQVDGNKTQFLCFEGLVETYFKGSPDQKVMLHTGQFTMIHQSPPSLPQNISSDSQRSFHREPSRLKDVLNQSGGDGLHKKDFLPPPPPQEARREGNYPSQNRSQNHSQNHSEDQQALKNQTQEPDGNGRPPPGGEGPPPPPPQAPLLPGGNQNTPPALGPSSGGDTPSTPTTPPAPTTTPVDVPVTFPTPG